MKVQKRYKQQTTYKIANQYIFKIKHNLNKK